MAKTREWKKVKTAVALNAALGTSHHIYHLTLLNNLNCAVIKRTKMSNFDIFGQ